MEKNKNKLAQINDILIERFKDNVSISDIAIELGKTDEKIIEIGAFYGLDIHYYKEDGGVYLCSSKSEKQKVTNEILDKFEDISFAVEDLKELLRMHK